MTGAVLQGAEGAEERVPSGPPGATHRECTRTRTRKRKRKRKRQQNIESMHVWEGIVR